MLLKLVKKWIGDARPNAVRGPDSALLEKAQQLMLAGDNQGAIKAYRQYLETDPYNVSALNDLGACLVDTGDLVAAVSSLELAYTLDDTFVPAMTNYAKLLNDHYSRGGDALKLLRRAKIARPEFMHTEAVYAGVCFKRGEGAKATRFQQRAWLANFDTLRIANGVMFWGAYDATEAQTAAEHRFWAETLRPLEKAGSDFVPRPPGDRIRIGYWSPDFRGHSVRFFFRPLLENHDRSRFEVVLFHDCPLPDEQTQKIRAAAEHFHDVHEMNDATLREFIREQQLDIIVDLAGHTSFNRLPLLQERLATLQVNALGYPPTTGLASVDAKLIDRHVATADDSRYYAEKPMVVAGSFWCYDPMEDVEEPAEPPVLRNGFVTFGCVGNIAKITADLLAAWKTILERVPDARLLLRSINFEDQIAVEAMRSTLAQAQIPLERVELLPPKGGAAFYTSYHEIDLILDTFPFNGGTTTCFATYMGVPVVTLAGESLVSRMGLSVMTNLGAPELAVRSIDEYVERAVAVARDTAFLAAFRRQARERYRSSALGNGRIFAKEFEDACEAMLAEKRTGSFSYRPQVPSLPEKEVMRRAYAVIRRGQIDAAERVLAYCLRCYPESGKPHLLKAQMLVWGRHYLQALQYVEDRMATFAASDRASALLVVARLHLLLVDRAAAGKALAAVRELRVEDPFDRLQVDFLAACAAPRQLASPQAAHEPETVLFVVPCDDAARFERLRAHVASTCLCPEGWQVRFERCAEDARIGAYDASLRADSASIVVLLQKNVEIHSDSFLLDAQAALQGADIIGCVGARRWTRLDWRLDEFEQKAGSFATLSSEREGMVEVHWFGPGREVLVGGLAVLDGSVLVLRPAPGGYPPFDEKLLSAGTLLEEAWVFECARHGRRLAVHRNFGAFIDSSVALDESDRTEARVHYALERSFDPFAAESDDYFSVSGPAADAAEAVAVCRTYLEPAA
jgi:protein O-GlcNAc transferase